MSKFVREWKVPCKSCGAAIGEPCISQETGLSRGSKGHPVRMRDTKAWHRWDEEQRERWGIKKEGDDGRNGKLAGDTAS